MVLQIISAIIQLSSIIFAVLLIFSAKNQEAKIQNTVYLIVYSVIFIISSINKTILALIPQYGIFLGYGLGLVFDALSILGAILLLLYAIRNRDYFGEYLIFSAAIILINLSLQNTIQYIFTPLFQLWLDVSIISYWMIIVSIIGSVLFLTSLTFLLVHGIKNEDIYMIIAAILQICIVITSIILSILSFMVLLSLTST